MTTNVGTLDRSLRAILGLGLLYMSILSGIPAFDVPVVKYGAIAVAVVMLGVAITRSCPIYSIFGFKTCGA